TSPSWTRPSSSRETPCRPALAAGPSGTTRTTRTPLTPSCAACWSDATFTPSPGRVTLPLRISCGTTRLISSTGTAKPMPALLPDLEVVRLPDQDGPQLVGLRVDAEHGDVLAGEGADQPGPVGGAVVHRHLGGVGAEDDVDVGDDVPPLVPDEARAGPLRHLL